MTNTLTPVLAKFCNPAKSASWSAARSRPLSTLLCLERYVTACVPVVGVAVLSVSYSPKTSCANGRRAGSNQSSDARREVNGGDQADIPGDSPFCWAAPRSETTTRSRRTGMPMLIKSSKSSSNCAPRSKAPGGGSLKRLRGYPRLFDRVRCMSSPSGSVVGYVKVGIAGKQMR